MTPRESAPIPAPCDIQGLLAQVHEKVGTDVRIGSYAPAGPEDFGEPEVTVGWYSSAPFEEHFAEGSTLEAALRAVLAFEDGA
jgi:hypothetical protein